MFLWLGPVLPAGTIIHYPVDFGEPVGVEPHFVLLVDCSGVYYRGFVIKSGPTEWQKESSEQMNHLVTIDQQSHPFLTHDSVINCTYLHPIRVQDVKQHLRERPKDRKGVASGAVKATIITAIKTSRLLSPIEKLAITKALS